jgi:hypothetical protein
VVGDIGHFMMQSIWIPKGEPMTPSLGSTPSSLLVWWSILEIVRMHFDPKNLGENGSKIPA